MKSKIGCVLMAAGNSRRFGENKLNKRLGSVSLIDRALNCVPNELLHKVAVVSQYDEVLQKAEKLHFIPVKNKHPDYGISHTIALGLKQTDDCDAVMFMVSDQPLLKKESVSAMLRFYDENRDYIVGLSYNGVRGNPCVFPREFYSGLYDLTEDHGGNTLIRNHLDRLKLFQASHPDELSDIDTIGDFDKLSNTEV